MSGLGSGECGQQTKGEGRGPGLWTPVCWLVPVPRHLTKNMGFYPTFSAVQCGVEGKLMAFFTRAHNAHSLSSLLPEQADRAQLL